MNLGTAQGATLTVSTANIAQTLETDLGAAKIVRKANIMWTQRAALVVKEAAEDTKRASQIVGL